MSTKATTNKSGLPDWFPLAIYGKNHTEDEWLEEIAFRAALMTQRKNLKVGKGGGIDVDSRSLGAFNALVVKKNERSGGSLAKTPVANFWPVREPTPFELLFLTQEFSGKDYNEARLWATRLHGEPEEWIASFHEGDVCERLQSYKRAPKSSEGEDAETNYYNDIVGKCVPLWVDLDHDDETIKVAFQVWLVGMRDALGEKAKLPIGEKDFAKWTRFKLLEAFDLIFWSEVNDLKYTDAYIAKTLWPDFSSEDDFVDVTERYRKVTKPLVKEVFGWNFVQRFWRQVELSKALESLVEQVKAERKVG